MLSSIECANPLKKVAALSASASYIARSPVFIAIL